LNTKEIRLSVRIGEHDFNFRTCPGGKIPSGDGDKIKLEIVIKGRERQHPEKPKK